MICICIAVGSFTAIKTASAATVCSTPGKDGPGTPSGVVNTYFPGSASVSPGAMSITLGSSSGASTAIAAGDLLLVIQMQDADINTANTSNYGSGSGTGAGYTSQNQTGLYEFVKATNAVGTGGGTVNLATGLFNSYRSRAATATNGQSTFQVIRVPQYTTATVSGTLSAFPWNGSRGGIVAIDVAGALTISGTVEADGKGFRGGWGEASNTTGPDTDYRTLATVLGNGGKGEGTAGTPNKMNQPASFNAAPAQVSTGTSLGYPNGANTNASKGRGAPGNAGGGGTDGNTNNDENSGGGGGGNYGAGGKGGNSWSSNLPVGGEGGAAAAIAYNRIVLGGGGGAGTSNDSTADIITTYTNPAGNACATTDGRCSSGAPGGGIIILRAQSVSGGGSISARGGTAYNVENDSSGGGGAGGSIVLETQLGGSATVNVSGGDGGNAWRSHTTLADRHGPGGGGSGGFIAYSPAGFNLNGTTTGGVNGKSCLDDAYGSGSSSGGIYAYQAPNVPGSEPGYICQPALSIAKSTTTPVVNASGTASYTITVRNNGVATASAVSISDILPGSPAHFTNASAAPALTYTPALCATRTATTNAAVGTSTPAWSLWDIAAGCRLDLAFNVTVPSGTIPATYQNPASATFNGNTITYDPLGSTAEDVTVRAPVSAAKSFSPAAIAAGGQSTVTFTLTNQNPAAITGVGFTDTLPTAAAGAPGNMTVANPPAPVTTCGGAPVYTAVNGSGSFTVSGLTVPANNSCNVSFTVTAVQAGIYVNTVPASAISGSTGTSTTPATASLTVANSILPPTIAKTFSPNPILPGGTTTLSFTLTNPNAATAIGSAGFADSLPNNLTIAATPNITSTCGGTVTAAAGSASISLNTDGTIPAAGSCTVSVDVTGTVAGIYQNTTGQVEGDTGTGNRATASLTIMAPLIVQKQFLTNPVARATATTLQVTLTNPNNFGVTGAAFLDTYPTGLINSTPANAAVSCTGGGSATLQGGVDGGSTVGITAGSVTAGNSCTVTVSVQAATAGLYTNSTGTVTTTNSGTSAAVTAGLTVLAPPAVSKRFNPEHIATGGSTTMTIVVENPATNTASLTGVTLLDNYPAGMTNSAAGSAPVCTTGASASLTGGVSGGATVGLNSGTIPPGGFCTITQQVTTTQDATNTTNAPTSTNGGNGIAASAFLKFLKPIVVSKSFSNYHPGSGTTDVTMTIAIFNPNPIAATSVAFTDTYPANMTNSVNNPASPTFPGGNCGSTASETYTSGGGNLVFANGQIPANSTCTVTQLTRFGSNNTSYSNTVTVNTGNMGSDSDTSIVTRGSSNAVPYFSKGFAPNPILPGGTTTLTFTITNPHTATVNTLAFTDTLPTGLTATNVGATAAGSCPGTYTITGGSLITYTGGATTLAAGASCNFGISTITSSTPGIYINTTGNISGSTGTGGPAEASLAVTYPPTITKSFNDATIASGGTTDMTIRIVNRNAFALTTVAFTDSYPAGLTNSGAPGATASPATCTGTLTAANNGASFALSAGTVPAGATCTYTVQVMGTTAGTKANSSGAVTSANAPAGTAATAALNVVAAPPTITKSFLPSTIAAGGTSTVLITLYNPNSVTIALSSVFTDSLPAGVVTAGTPNRSTTCTGGTVGGTAGTITLSLGALIPPGTSANPGSCTIQTDVTAAASGIYTNDLPAGALSTNAGSNAASAQAVLTVSQYTPPTVSKAFGTTQIGIGMATTLTLTLTNTNSVAATLTANLDDNLPTNLVVASPNGLTGTCTLGSVTATPGTNLIRYATAASIPPGGCTIVVNVSSASAAAYTNTIAANELKTSLGNNPGPTSDVLTVYGQPLLSILKSANRATASPGEVIIYNVQIVNSGTGIGTNVVLTDDLSPYGSFYLGAGTPFSFTDSSPVSGLSLSAPQYSNNNGTTWLYPPVSGGGGAPAGYDGNVTNWRIPMTGTIRAGGSFILNYQVIVK